MTVINPILIFGREKRGVIGLIFLALLSTGVFSALKGLSSEIFSAESGNIQFISFKGREAEY